MPKVQIYDKAMCCSTGVCGPQVDPVLPRFAADLEWLQSQGHDVDRFNLAQEPAEFVKNSTVQKLLTDEGVECLPLVIIDDRVVSQGEYPTRENLALWTGTSMKATLPMASDSGCCGGNSGCCK
ncbi:MAG: arsenite efflux transporter metallochaperone ArsD [Planctomycetales bacterium]|nr:arsenite efflux transporter metallochaperone ArsD [Planctomycetales bacterium]